MPPVRIVRQSSKYAAGKLSSPNPRSEIPEHSLRVPSCTLTFVQKCNYRDHMNVHEESAHTPVRTAKARSLIVCKKPRWIDSFAATSTLPASGLEPVSNPSEPSTSPLKASMRHFYHRYFHRDRPPVTRTIIGLLHARIPALAVSTIGGIDASLRLLQPSFADLAPSESSSSTFAPTPDYSYWSSPPMHNLDHWYQPQFQLRNTSIPTNFN
ncbi:hypothetical protein CPB85DRAFT_1565799 [Mucidula mucida]|nr:hypothetical protein CPB85DRAFT_1565799 [Mucidula mucida]